jgi:hypothetical protein
LFVRVEEDPTRQRLIQAAMAAAAAAASVSNTNGSSISSMNQQLIDT